MEIKSKSPMRSKEVYIPKFVREFSEQQEAMRKSVQKYNWQRREPGDLLA